MQPHPHVIGAEWFFTPRACAERRVCHVAGSKAVKWARHMVSAAI